MDAGCGSLAFTASTYGDYSERPIVFLDKPVKLLRLAKARLIKLSGGVPPNGVFLHGDVLHLPFKPNRFGTIVALNLLHVLEDTKRVLQELRNVLLDGGSISLTTLIENNRLADRYLHMCAKAGEIVPRNVNQLPAVFDELGMPVRYRIQGNMALICHR